MGDERRRANGDVRIGKDETVATSGEQALRPRARILRTFGDELISSELVAIIELVKNAYDADATAVLIRFTPPLQAGAGRIEVIDNGNGMSVETVLSAWMEPATLYRSRATISEVRHRRVTGEKGVGRFAAARLGEQLELITRRRGDDTETRALFDWRQFDDPERYLDEILSLWEQVPAQEISSTGTLASLASQTGMVGDSDLIHGTVLRMDPLRRGWSEAQLIDVRRGLSRLIFPDLWKAGDRAEDEFRIFLDVPEPLAHISGEVLAPETLRRARYTLIGHVDADGSYELSIQIGDDTPEHVTGSVARRGHVPQCGQFDIQLRVWDRDHQSMRELADIHDSTVANIRRDLDSAAGINVFRDGFRVLPYGEPQQDWLRLDLRRVQNPTQRVSNNQVIGYVSISSDRNPDLRDQSNREGLMEGSALDDLREAIKTVLHELEVRRYRARRTERTEPRGGGVFQGFDLASLRDAVRERHADDAELLAAIDEKETDLERRVAEVQEVLSRYRRLATLGQLVDRILHDGRTPVTKIGNEVTLASRDIDRSQDPGATLAAIRRRIELIERATTSLSTLFARIEPFGGRRRGRPRPVDVEKIVADAFDLLESEISEVGAQVALPSSHTTVTVDAPEIEQVVLNLLENSLYWLRNVPKDRRAIDVQVLRPNEDEVHIIFSDSGPGVDPNFREEIFQPYFSMKPEGVGLGLTIVGEIITDYYAGSVELVDGGALPGATFRVVLRRRI